MGRASCDVISCFLRRFFLHFRLVPGAMVTLPQARLAPRAAVRVAERREQAVMVQAVQVAWVVAWPGAVDLREMGAGAWPRKR